MNDIVPTQKNDFKTVCKRLSSGSTVLLRVDFNLSRDSDGKWLLNDRLFRMIPVIKDLLAMQHSVILVSHLGRPRPGVFDENYSLSTLCAPLEASLSRPVAFLSQWPYQKTFLAPGTVALAENTRFLVGELENDAVLAQQMVDGIDCVVMEAFACSHRRHASTVGILQAAEQCCLGPTHTEELSGIASFLKTSTPRVAYVGGKKLSTKLPLLEKLLETVDMICFGGGIASTLLHAKGFQTGTSWIEYNRLQSAQAFAALAQQQSVELVLPVDVVVSSDTEQFSNVRTVDIHNILPHEAIVDIGPQTSARFESHARSAASTYWNGPMGIYEYRTGVAGSAHLASTLSNAQAYTLVGGGDTLSVLEMLNVNGFSHVSTGGGAFLHYLAHGTTPVLQVMSLMKVAI